MKYSAVLDGQDIQIVDQGAHDKVQRTSMSAEHRHIMSFSRISKKLLMEDANNYTMNKNDR